MELYIFKQTVFTNTFTTVITKQYFPVSSEMIDWRWEMTKGYWDNDAVYKEGFVPYVNGVIENIYEHRLSVSSSEMCFVSILANDNSDRLYCKLFPYFKLNEPV
jgi:hypothetical protein